MCARASMGFLGAEPKSSIVNIPGYGKESKKQQRAEMKGEAGGGMGER